MIKHSVLFGNGVNIQFCDNKEEYQNKSIIIRALNNMKSGKYTKVFADTIKPDELYEIMIKITDFYNNYLKKGINYKNTIDTDDEFSSFMEVVFRYKDTELQPEDIMMEDYFLLFNLFNNFWIHLHQMINIEIDWFLRFITDVCGCDL